jgi:endonuclease YncB( thermonuclease family)
MSKAYGLIPAALLGLAVALGSGAASALEGVGRVVGIQDGDTLTLLDGTKRQHRIRIAGIDAPEKAQAFGEAARENLARLAFGKAVEVRCAKRDRYGRAVCNVYSGGRDLGLEQVRGGFAWWYRDYSREQSPAERAAYEEAEREAREWRRGLWRDAAPTAPWAWRREPRG